MYYGYGGGFDTFTLFEKVFPVFFLIFIGIFVFAAIKGIRQWSSNNTSPTLSVEANVAAKRTDTSSTFYGNAGDLHHGHHATSTFYYATFEVESGDRMEFLLSAREYGMLAEGDKGKLTFQGTRYKGFERQV